MWHRYENSVPPKPIPSSIAFNPYITEKRVEFISRRLHISAVKGVTVIQVPSTLPALRIPLKNHLITNRCTKLFITTC